MARALSETTSRTRRRALPAPDVLNTRFVEGAGVVQPEPAPPNPPQPFGDLAAASVEELFEAADMVGDGDASSVRSKRRQSVSAITQYLSAFPGGTWQERWTASELDDAEDPIPFSQVRRRWVETGSIVQGVTLMTTFRAIHPSLRALRANMLPNFAEVFLTGQGTADIDAALRAIESSPYSGLSRRRARHDLAAALVTQKIAMSDLTPSALLHYAWEWRRICTTIGNGEVSFGARVLWEILCETGHFPPTTPNTLRRALNGNPHDLAALISRYELRNKAVERLLVDYMRIRVADGLDFSSASALARTLARNFWQTIESVNPDQNDLRLSPETYRAWLERISVKADGQPRIDTDNIQLAVRAFYLDLSAWATAEPERWGMWAAPNPIPPSATRGYAVRQRRRQEGIADRIRILQPLLPRLVQHIDDELAAARRLLAATQKAQPGELFTCEKIAYRRMWTKYDSDRARWDGTAPVRAQRLSDATVTNAELTEDTAFWTWAVIHTLRLTGVRIEELLELSHLSIRQYQRPNGEVIGLLVIAPSKTDRERVIPMSAELFHVIAEIIRRLTRTGRPIRLVRR
ncbi:hypothetical protein OIE52_05205 [Streptomyces canus]|uniref:hypothetical protein n=1 Tax=Streptomyces canus TaxID=58343 RepID=UPI00324C5CFD